MNPIKARLQEFISYKGISQSCFERTANLSNGVLNKQNVGLSKNSVTLICKAYPELNRTWLETGEGEMLNPTPSKVNSGANSGDNYGSGPSQRGNKNILINNDPKTIEEEERKICDLEKEITHLKERITDKDKTIADKDARIAELNATIARLEKMNDYLMQNKPTKI